LSDDVVHSLILESVGSLIDLAYQPTKPTMVVRSDCSVNIYGGSVNENLDVQSHVDVESSIDEVPDIDMMMAICPSQIGLEVSVGTSCLKQSSMQQSCNVLHTSDSLHAPCNPPSNVILKPIEQIYRECG